MNEFIQSLLLRWAYGPPTHSAIRNLLRKFARARLHSDSDGALQVGTYDHVIATHEPALPSGANLRQVADSFRPLNLPVIIGGEMILEGEQGELHTVAVPTEQAPDPDMDYWLEEVTEPYILWDAPKPNFAFSTDYFYDYSEPVLQLHIPPYVPPAARGPRPETNPRVEAFSNLSNDRNLFTLPPESVRLRSARLRVSHELG